MYSYHFVIGAPGDLLRIDASIRASDPIAAVNELRNMLGRGINLTPHLDIEVGYAQICVNADQIGVQHIVRVDSDEADVGGGPEAVDHR